MSKAGDAKKRERIIKKCTKEIVTPYKNMSPRKQKLWDIGTGRLIADLRKLKEPRS